MGSSVELCIHQQLLAALIFRQALVRNEIGEAENSGKVDNRSESISCGCEGAAEKRGANAMPVSLNR